MLAVCYCGEGSWGATLYIVVSRFAKLPLYYMYMYMHSLPSQDLSRLNPRPQHLQTLQLNDLASPLQKMLTRHSLPVSHS